MMSKTKIKNEMQKELRFIWSQITAIKREWNWQPSGPLIIKELYRRYFNFIKLKKEFETKIITINNLGKISRKIKDRYRVAFSIWNV